MERGFLRILRKVFFVFLSCALVGNLSVPKAAGEAAKSENPHDVSERKDAKGAKDQKEQKEETDKLVVTQHSATIQDEELKYTVTAGKLVMRDDDDKPKALVFFVAYTKDGVAEPARRPVTFAFNGGPRAGAFWLRLCLVLPPDL